MDSDFVCADPACADKIQRLTEQVTKLENDNADLNGQLQDIERRAVA